ncbi:ferritin-like domain-containing protein [Nocardia paucivorans]|uniref:ferritin-like domain-containing protein n=1 Tax=Nocardia paucivorans TaxID=114259 RepID=UPI0002DDF96D|nr:ferritin-like domain-containing protein [Nocardia paucivorans]
MSDTDTTQALLDALDAEYAAVYAYGLVMAYTAPENRLLIHQYSAAHRARRDATVDALTAIGVTVPPAEPAYTVPEPPSDPSSAYRLAVTVETDTAMAWRAVVEQADSSPTRRAGVEALTECAVRLATWQRILGAEAVTTAFPGRSAS